MAKLPCLPTAIVAALALSLPSFTRGFSFNPAGSSAPKHRPSSVLPFTATASAVDAASSIGAGAASKFWKWRGHDIFAEVRGARQGGEVAERKPAVILLHGFGASTTYWRETMSVLHTEGYDVHALDLLGQGRSSKPFSAREVLEAEEDFPSMPYRLYTNAVEENEDGSEIDAPSSMMEMGKNTDTEVEYSIDLWASLVDDYARHHQLDEVVLMGNSLGSLVALSVATGDFADSPDTERENSSAYLAGNDAGERARVAGVCLFNCAVGLNSRNVIKNKEFGPIRRAIFNALFDILNNLIFDNELLLRFALDNVVTKELLEDALRSLYTFSPERVDRELVDSFYYPAKLGGDGAVEAIRQIYTNDAGLTPMEFHKKYPEKLDSLPLHLVWGLEDAITPIGGDVGTFYCDRVANNRGGKGMTTIDVVSSGHMPFDDNPVDSHEAMVRWLERKVVK